VSGQIALGVRLESFADHYRTKVGTSDTDVDDIGDGLSGVTLPLARTDSIGELLHVVEDSFDLVGSLFLDVEGLGVREDVTQSDVQDSSTFRGVDVFSSEHGISESRYLGFTSQSEKGLPDFRGDQVLGEIEQDLILLSGRGGLVEPGVGLESVVTGLREERLESESLMLLVIQLLELFPALVVCGMIVSGE
jgi:hypothetical protein